MKDSVTEFGFFGEKRQLADESVGEQSAGIVNRMPFRDAGDSMLRLKYS
jgi:hypothetical protein